MSLWKPTAAVFFGGTEQMKALTGRKVRTRVPLQNIAVYDPIHGKQETFSLRQGAVGLIANPHPVRFDFLIAFPVNGGQQVTSLDQLSRSGAFKVLVINEPTFKMQFEIEMP